MRTRITSGWLVAHAAGHHTLWRNAELVYEGNAVLFVGERFEGAVDREIDARERPERPIPSVLASVRAVWLASAPKPAVPRIG